METAARIPEAINSFAAAIAAVPVPLLTINSTLLNSLLSTVASDLAPALSTLAQAQQEALLTNSTFLAQQFGSLSSFLGGHFRTDLSAVSHADAIAMVEIAAARYDIMAVWAPDVWAIVVLFVAAAFLKLALVGMLTPQAIGRAERAAESSSVAPEKPSREERELARSRLQKPARAALGHALNLIISTIVIVLQAMAWRLFVLPNTPIRPLDAKLMTAAVKLLLTGYAADLLFGDLRAEIFLHHFFTFALLFIGQLAAFKCQVFAAAGHARANDLRVDGRVAHEYLSPPSRSSAKLAATSPEGSVLLDDCHQIHHVSSKIRARRIRLVLAGSDVAQHRWHSLGTHLDRMVHPHPRPPSRYPGQVCRRRVPTSGAHAVQSRGWHASLTNRSSLYGPRKVPDRHHLSSSSNLAAYGGVSDCLQRLSQSFDHERLD